MIRKLIQNLKSDTLDHEFLPHALEIEETPASPVRRLLIWLIFGMVLLVFLWSYFGRVDEVAVARGKIIPDGRIKVIQPMETGVLKAIHVKEGQRVKEGELLIELDTTIKQADAESAARTLTLHMADKDMLVSELDGNEPVNNRRAFTAYQKKLKTAREGEYRAKEDALALVVSQRENALQATEAILSKLEKTTLILREQEAAYSRLNDRGYIARMDLLERQKELFTVQHELEAQRKIVIQARENVEESKKNLDALRKERDKNILSDIVEREKTISSLQGEVVKTRKKYELETLVSPVDGTVHGLSSYTIGGVVTSAQPVITIVPEGTPLVIEAMAQNRDIGFIREGQEAEIKLDTFPFQKYGVLRGRVVSISPDAVDDEKQGLVYKIRVVMEKHSLSVDGRDLPVSPGMALSVEVKTGRRRIIEFFLSPLVKYARESLTLR